MPYSEELARRVREVLQNTPGYTEKKMFGGICSLIHGNMACGILNQDLIVRVGRENHASCLDMPHIREFDITGRTMTGWIMVAPEGHADEEALRMWVEKGVRFARSLPAK